MYSLTSVIHIVDEYNKIDNDSGQSGNCNKKFAFYLVY